MKQFIILWIVLSSYLFSASPVYKILMSKHVQKPYNEDVYKKTIILMTEARLFLQKKYKKKIIFEYQTNLLKSKEDMIKELKSKDARFYIYLDIKKRKQRQI